uniref:Peptidyl-prolyl cis-trans isomerase n=1 Tax=Albugo laibachii Nc14 TaxID=890382 RepID=F0W4Y9_9STRA|nr:peptidylprolyl cistrans isomerase NIMAinteracting 1 putative [Albugo laibachii Nc14]|eukprot:CCA16179.1 peptidylprolyl cistrans isomerase NIMAinteracting 1 putative [Albugo laibachii Nc14]
MSTSKDAKQIPKGWKEVQSKSRPGSVYFLNVKTGEKTWKLSHVHAKEREYRREKHGAKVSQSNALDKVQALHILVKHAQSRRPSSWRQESITRSKAVAVNKIQGIHERLMLCKENNGSTAEAIRALFEEIAKEESDCSSAKRGGDLGMFTRGQMQASFEAAAFALEVNQLSDIVESDSGIHLILRVA